MLKNILLILTLCVSGLQAFDLYKEEQSTDTATYTYESQAGQAGGNADMLDGYHASSFRLNSTLLDLSSDVTGSLGITHFNGGANASNITFWRGDGTWVAVPGGGDMLQSSHGANIASSTATLRLDLVTETNARVASDAAIDVSTGSIRSDLNAVILSTGVHKIIAGNNITLSPSGGQGDVTITASAMDTTSIAASTTSLRNDLSTETASRQTADGAVGASTGTLRSDLTTETNARANADTAMGVSTGTLRTDLTNHTHTGVYQPANANLDDLADGSLTASKVGTGYPVANLGAGTVPDTVKVSTASMPGIATATTFLRGDGTWQTVSAEIIQPATQYSFGSKTDTSLDNEPWVTINSSGASLGLQINIYGNPADGAQMKSGAFTTSAINPNGKPATHIVSVDSTTDVQDGYGIWEIWEENPLHNDPLIWIHNKASNSAPFMRVDDPQPDLEIVNTSTDYAHGLGQWEPFASPYQGSELQVNSRAWNDQTFQNVSYWLPLTQGGGLFLAPVIYGDDDNPHVSDTQYITFFTTSGGHGIGITGPKQVASGSWTFGLPNTSNNQGQVMYQKDNGDSTGVRNWAFTTGGTTGDILSYNSLTNAPEWKTAISSVAANTVGTAQLGAGVMKAYDYSICISSPYALGTTTFTVVSPYRSYAVHVTTISAHAVNGTNVVLTIEKRADSLADTANGTAIVTGTITATGAGWIGGAFNDNAIPANSCMAVKISSVSGNVDRLVIKYSVTVD